MAFSDDDSILDLDTNPNDLDFLESNDSQKLRSINKVTEGKLLDKKCRSQSETRTNDEFYGPRLPPKNTPQNNESILGPALPPDLVKKSNSFIGPELPKQISFSEDNLISSESKLVGPALPPHLTNQSKYFEETYDDDIIGPLPGMISRKTQEQDLASQVDDRAHRMREKLTEKDVLVKKSRETWMLELPPDRANEFGLGPRQFRQREKEPMGDRSVWTTIPGQEGEMNNPSTSNEKEEIQDNFIKERDEAMQKLADSHKSKKKKESLLEKHQKKLKKKKKKESSKPYERRPFDRNIDLQANRFDEAQKKAIINKAQLLNDRFSQGKSKFL